MNRRRALLLAIASYDGAPPLDFVSGDIPRLRRALPNASVLDEHVVMYGAGCNQSKDLTTSRMRRYIKTFLDESNPEDDLIIYFTGHGIEQDGRRLLIPQDYDLTEPFAASQMISDNDLFSWCRSSKAGSVLILVDACREGVRLELGPENDGSKSVPDARKEAGAALPTEAPTIAIVYSCGQGEKSHPAADRTCSAFTNALADILEAEDDRATLSEIIPALQTLLDFYAQSRQTITLDERRITGRRGTPDDLIIKESAAARFRARLDHSPWVGKLRNTTLWRKANEELALGAQISAIVLRAEEHVTTARRACQQG